MVVAAAAAAAVVVVVVVVVVIVVVVSSSSSQFVWDFDSAESLRYNLEDIYHCHVYVEFF